MAQATPPEEVFAAVVEEVGQLFRVGLAALVRYEPGGTATTVTLWRTAVKNLPVGSRWPLEGHNVTTLVFETGRPARVNGHADKAVQSGSYDGILAEVSGGWADRGAARASLSGRRLPDAAG